MSGLKVLVFEADHGFAASLTRAFQRRGCTVTVVDDGQVGLDLAQTSRPDLIVLSIELPRMNGFAVCNRLKKHPDLKDVPLIIVSAESPQETFEQHSKLRTRAEDYAHKPIAPEEIIRRASAFVTIPPVVDTGDLGEEELLIDEALIADERDLHPHTPPSPMVRRPVDAELEGLTDAAFDHIMLDAPAEPEPLSLDGGLEPAADRPFLTPLEPLPDALPPVPDDFEDFTVVSTQLSGQLKAAFSPFPTAPSVQPALIPSTPPPPLPRVIPAEPLPAPAPTPVEPALSLRDAVQQGGSPAAAQEEAARLRVQVEDLARELSAARAVQQQVVALTEDTARSSAQAEAERLRAVRAEEERATLARALDDATARAEAAQMAQGAAEAALTQAQAAVHAAEERARSAQSAATTAAAAAASTPAAPGQSMAPGPRAGGVSTREFLELRESLNRKDKEILSLKDQVNGRDKELLEIRDRVLIQDREKNDLEERMLAREMELATLAESTASLTADRDAAARTAEALRAELTQAREAVVRLTSEQAAAVTRAEQVELSLRGELAAARDAHVREMMSLQATHDSAVAEAVEARTRAEAAVTAAQDRHAQDLTALRDTHAGELTAVRDTHTRDVAAARDAHTRELTTVRDAHARELTEAEARRSEDLAGATAALATAQSEHARALADAEARLALEVASARQETLEAHEATQNAQEAARKAQEELRAAHVAELAQRDSAHAVELARREGAHSASVTALRDDHVRALGAERDAHAATRAELAAERERLTTRLNTAEEGLMAAAARETALGNTLADVRTRLEAAERSLEQSAALFDRTRRALHLALAFVEEAPRGDRPSTAVASAE